MNDENIKPGDLVVVIGKHCKFQTRKHIGKVLSVVDVQTRALECAGCRQSVAATFVFCEQADKKRIFALNEVKKIPPLNQLEGAQDEIQISRGTSRLNQAEAKQARREKVPS